jgi:hypothetical protein
MHGAKKTIMPFVEIYLNMSFINVILS